MTAVVSTLLTVATGSFSGGGGAGTPTIANRPAVAPATGWCYECYEGIDAYGGPYHVWWEIGAECSAERNSCVDCTRDAYCMMGGDEAVYTDPQDAGSWLATNGCGGGTRCSTDESPAEYVQALLEVDDATASEVLVMLIESAGGSVQYNASRQAIQIYGCGGIIAQIDVGDSIHTALTSERRQGAGSPARLRQTGGLIWPLA
jgi:hypothetical protein